MNHSWEEAVIKPTNTTECATTAVGFTYQLWDNYG